MIQDDQGKKHAAVLKGGSPEEIAAEATASLLLSGWGLPTPQPYLVLKDGAVCFASADVGFPNLKKRLIGEQVPTSARAELEALASRLVCTFQSMPLAAACDEAIDNRDRNFGNILWDGQDEIWIDHAYSFGVGNRPDFNKLCMMAVAADATDAIQRSALAASIALDRTLPETAGHALRGTPVDKPELLDAVRLKLTRIGTALLARFPKPLDLFGEA